MSSLLNISPHVNIPKGSDRIEGLRAAAAAALKALAESGRSTVFFEDTSCESEAAADAEPQADSPAAQPAASHPPVNETSPAVLGSPKGAKDSPLAAFLGSYSDDESAGSDDASHEAAKGQQQQPSPQPTAANGSHMDEELSKFMQELESSGLLDADSDMTDAEQAATATPAAAAGSSGAAHGAAAPAALPAGSEAAGPADGAVSSDAPGSSPGGWQSAAVAAAAAGEQQGPAEQRTLGMLAAAPDWYKVLDTGSGREYYWNVANNEVLWEPPEGIDGDALLPVPADSAATTHGSGAEAEDAAAVETAAVTGAAPATDAAPAAAQSQAEPEAAGAGDSAAGMVQETSGEQQPAQAPSDAVLQPAEAEHHAASSAEQLTGGDPEAPATATPGVAAAAGSLQQPQTAATAVPTPQQDIQPVFSTLLAELQAAPEVQQQLQALPAAVKLLLQLQVLQQQWAVFAAQQQGAAAGEDGGRGFGWADYEHYIMQQLQQAAQQLQPTLQALQQGALPQPQHDPLQLRPADQEQPAATTAAAETVQTAEGQHKAAAAAAAAGDVVQPQEQQQEGAAGQEEAEEGEVAPSSPSSASEGEDMEVDMEASPVQSAAVPAAAKQSKQQRQPEPRVSAAAEHRGHYQGPPAGGVYASTMHMPMWARPSYNNSFAGHDPSPAADYHAAYGSYAAGYDYGMQGYPAHYDYSSYGRGYGSAAAGGAAVEAAAAPAAAPPLPADEPPPLPDEAPPPLPTADAIHSSSSSAVATAVDAALDAGAAAAGGIVGEALPSGPAAKRQKIVAAPAVRRPAAVAAALPSGAEDSPAVFDEAELAAAAAAGISGKDGRKRARDQRAAATTLAPGTAGSKVKGGKVNALLNKWASVRQQQQEEEEQRQRQLEREADPEYLEAKRQRDLEQWSQQQMAAGAEDNPNFTPVMGDWRAKLGLDSAGGAAAGSAGRAAETPEERAARKAAKKAAKAAKKASAAAAVATAGAGGSGDGSSNGSAWPSSMKTKPDLAALSVGLPPGWVAMYEHDAKAGLFNIYYGNPVTKVLLLAQGFMAGSSRCTAAYALEAGRVRLVWVPSRPGKAAGDILGPSMMV